MIGERMIGLAEALLRQGNLTGAQEQLLRVLGEEPDHAYAHALLAVTLLRQHRLPAARYEIEAAIALEPEHPVWITLAATIARSDARLKDAEALIDRALALAPQHAEAHLERARLLCVRGAPATAREAWAAARALRPEDADIPAEQGLWELIDQGNLAAARELAAEAMALDPGNADARVLSGWLHLSAGDAATARDHALWVLTDDANDRSALALLTAVKARQSPVIGLWWRLGSWLQERGEAATVRILIGAFLIAQLGIQALIDLDQAAWARLLQITWLGFALYTWIAPALFQRALRREIESVRLKPF